MVAVIWFLSWRSPASSQTVLLDLAHQAAVGLANGGEFVANMVKWRPTLIIKPVPAQDDRQ